MSVVMDHRADHRKIAVQSHDLQKRRLAGDWDAEVRPLPEILLEAYERTGSTRGAALTLGISQLTYSRWVEDEGGHFERALVLPGYDRVSIPVSGGEEK